MQATDTREHILGKTFGLLLIKGYDGVSITDIQQATGLSRGLLYHYFGSKEKLFVEVTRKYFFDLYGVDRQRMQHYGVAEMIAYMAEKYGDIRSVLQKHAGEGSSVGIMNYDFLFYRVMQEDENFARQYTAFRRQELDAWEAVLGNSRARGDLREGIDLRQTARYFVLLLDGLWMEAVDRNDQQVKPDEVTDVLRGFARLILTGKVAGREDPQGMQK